MINTNDDSSGVLFNTINYQSEVSLEKFRESINVEQALYLVRTAIEFSHSKGMFNMNETELLNKSLRIIDKTIFSDDGEESTTNP
jgi:hypothetical protein